MSDGGIPEPEESALVRSVNDDIEWLHAQMELWDGEYDEEKIKDLRAFAQSLHLALRALDPDEHLDESELEELGKLVRTQGVFESDGIR